MKRTSAARFLLTMKVGAAELTATSDPSIDDVLVIGVASTTSDAVWSDAGATETYAWEYSADGSTGWATAAGMTTLDATPTDATFGYYLRLKCTRSGVTATSAASGARVAEGPSQSLGAELLTNPSFTAWTTDNPDGWTVGGESGSDPMVTQVASGGGAGTGAARMYASASSNQPTLTQNVLVASSYYEAEATLSASNSAVFLRLGSGGQQTLSNATVATTAHVQGRANNTNFVIIPSVSANDITIDAVTVKLLTPNTELTALSANMRIDQFFTLPGSPMPGECIRLFSRISSYASGNYWQVWLRYTVGSNWEIDLYSVASHTPTSRINVSGLSAPNGIRVNMNGDDISLYTTTNGGTNWTQRGTTISNALYNTATGVNAMWSNRVTIGNLVYAPAD